MRKRILVLCCAALSLAFATGLSAQIITSQPQSLTVNTASTATFTVGTSNTVSYQWQFNGANLSGETNSSLTLDDVMTNQAGSYAVVVNNSVTSSPPAVLTIVPGTIVRLTLTNLPPGAPTNAMDIQLFDHDKPVTVQNFIHYIRAGGYTNMFFDRLLPMFVLQGGDDGASNRTDATPPITGWDINTQFTTAATQPNPPYPAQIINEFGFGPYIPNHFGTVAMALGNNTNSGNSAFFINLIDNSANLDSQDFTVFGRIIDGTNVLGFLNGVTNGGGAVGNGMIVTDNGQETNQVPGIGDGSLLPVNYIGTNAPANSNLLFCDFSFLTQPVVDTNPPTVAITTVVTNGLLTNDFEGTASDDVGLAGVIIYLTQEAVNGVTNSTSTTNYATGTSNWSFNLSPGVYEVGVQAQDGAGNLSVRTNVTVTNTSVFVVGKGNVSFSGSLSNNTPIGYALQQGVTYGFTAIPAPGYTFLNWLYGGEISINPSIGVSFNGDLLVATFIASNTPTRARAISFVYPRANAVLTTNQFTVKGTITPAFKSAQVNSQIYSQSTGMAVGPMLPANGTTTWAAEVTNLPPDNYLIQSVATNADGYSTVITEEFTVQAFKRAAGTYSGLFLCTSGPVGPTNSGLITLTFSANGTYTATLRFPQYGPVTTDYHFSLDGSMTSPYRLFLDNPVQLTLSADLTQNTQILTGTLNAYNGTWSSQVLCYRSAAKLSALTTPATGKYIFELEPTNLPGTNGYATVSISGGGSVVLSGEMPDGAAFSQATRISGSGVWPFYAVPSGYKTNGMLVGWITNGASGTGSGQLYWFKRANIGKYFTNGVNTLVTATGTNYEGPAAGNYSIVFQGGTLNLPVTNNLTVARARGPFKPEDTTDKLGITLSATGVLTGHFFDNELNETLQFKGGFAGPSQGGSGFILEEDGQTGSFSLEPQ